MANQAVEFLAADIDPFALLELQEAAPAGEDYLFPHYRTQGTNATTSALLKAMKRAGVEYKAPWLNLRRTRSTELADRLPAHVVSAWMGHNDEIANAHYRRPTDDHYTAAAMFQTGGGGGGGGMSKTDENLEKLRADAVAIVEAKTRKIPDNSAVEARKPLKNKGFPLALVGIEQERILDGKTSGLRDIGENERHRIRHIVEGNGPEGEAFRELVEVWPGLPAEARARVVEVLREVLAEVVGEVRR